MYRKFTYLIALLLFTGLVTAQDLEDRTLITIDGHDYDAGGFMRSYLKNIDDVQDPEQKDIDNYLDLYIDYRIKLIQAREQGLDKREAYLKEVANWREVLAEKYLTDTEVTDALVREAYDRKTTEINAAHILVKAGRADSAEDTLKAYRKMQDIVRKIDDGMDFSEAAQQFSEGPSGKNGGDLGWFSVFKMVYPFESAAYKTSVGKVSDIFRTDFGYHIVKVKEKRDARGMITVAHIMTFDKNKEKGDAEARIRQAYKELEQGADFGELAKKYSNDLQSRDKNGEIPPFSTGGVNSEEFEDAAFALENPGDYTAPIKTQYGWHIIKLIEYEPIESYDDLKKELSSRIQRSPRARKITDAFTDRLKKLYNVKPNDQYLKDAQQIVGDTIMYGGYKVEGDTVAFAKADILTIKEQDYTMLDLLKFMEKNQMKYRAGVDTKDQKVELLYNAFIDTRLADYYDVNLERDNKEFAVLYKEYKEGLLLFELMQYMTEEKAKQDTVALRKVYDENRDRYQWNKRVKVDIVTIWNDSLIDEVHDELKSGITADSLKRRYKNSTRAQLMVTSGTVETDSRRLPEGFRLETGVSDVYDKDNRPVIVIVNEILQPAQKTFKEARPLVENHYQQELDKMWQASLREGRKIKVDRKTLKKVKKHLDKKV